MRHGGSSSGDVDGHGMGNGDDKTNELGWAGSDGSNGMGDDGK